MRNRVYADHNTAPPQPGTDAADVRPLRRVPLDAAKPFESCVAVLDLKVAAGGWSPRPDRARRHAALRLARLGPARASRRSAAIALRSGWQCGVRPRRGRGLRVRAGDLSSFKVAVLGLCPALRDVSACGTLGRSGRAVDRALRSGDAGVLIVLEDLDASGFDARPRGLNGDAVRACLRWLARFHATFLERAPEEGPLSGGHLLAPGDPAR